MKFLIGLMWLLTMATAIAAMWMNAHQESMFGTSIVLLASSCWLTIWFDDRDAKW